MHIDWFFRVPSRQQTACPVTLTSVFLLHLYDSLQFFKQEGILLRSTTFGFPCTSNWVEGKRNVLVCLSPPFAFGTRWLSRVIQYIESRIKMSNDIQWAVLGYLWRLSKCACCSCWYVMSHLKWDISLVILIIPWIGLIWRCFASLLF